ncbi:Transcriptional regulator [Planctomycetales bacterium 10988]|nr:Transcriptional regulator [Planctomycetales bacterium 10988]
MTLTEKRRKRRKDARPQEIIDAASEVFAEQGFAAAKVEEIAKRAGVAKGTVYLYFESKEALFEGLVNLSIVPVFTRLADQLDQFPGTAKEQLIGLVEQVYRELIMAPKRRVVMKILISEGMRFPALVEFYHREVIAGASELMRKILIKGVRDGEFRESSFLAEPKVIIGPAIMAAIWKMTFDSIAPLDFETFLEAHLDLILHGILSPNPKK